MFKAAFLCIVLAILDFAGPAFSQSALPPGCEYQAALEQISGLVQRTITEESNADNLRSKLRILDDKIYVKASKAISSCGAETLLELGFERQLGKYGDAEPIFVSLIKTKPQLRGELLPYWLEIIRGGFEKFSGFEGSPVLDKLKEMDHILVELASADASPQALELLADIAEIRAVRRYDLAVPLLDQISNDGKSESLSNGLRFKMAKAYLDANLLFEADRMVSGLVPKEPDEKAIAAGVALGVASAASIAKCTDPGLALTNGPDIVRGLKWILASSAVWSPLDFVGQASGQTGEVDYSIKESLGAFCSQDSQISQPLNWKNLFLEKPVELGDIRLPHKLGKKVRPQNLQWIAVDPAGSRIVASAVAKADEDQQRQAFYKLFDDIKFQLQLIRARNPDAKLSDYRDDDASASSSKALEVAIKGLRRMKSATFADVLFGGSVSGIEFILIIDSSPKLSFMQIEGNQRYFDFADFKGDGELMPVVHTFETSAGFMEADVIDVDARQKFEFGEAGDLYHGGLKLLDLDGDGSVELTISALHEDRLLYECNQCPSRRTSYVFSYAAGSFILKSTYETTAEVNLADAGGLMGISQGAALGFSRAEIQKQIDDFSSQSFKDISPGEAESLVGELSNQSKSFYEAGDSQTGAQIAHTILNRLDQVKGLNKWTALLDAKVRVEHAGALVDSGFDRDALAMLEDTGIRDAVSNGDIPKSLVASIQSRAAFGIGDLTTAYAANQIVMASPESFPGLSSYSAFLLDIGETEQAKSLAERAAVDGDASAITLLASIDGNLKNATALLHQAIVAARTDSDDNATAAIFDRAGQIALNLGHPDLAERFWASILFEAPPSWWARNGARLLLNLGRVVSSDKQLSTALLKAAARVGAKTYSAVTPEALYALAQSETGQKRFDLLASAYDAATQHRRQVPGEYRKITFVAATDRIADDFFTEALERGLPADKILSDLERWRFQVFTEVYSTILPPVKEAANNVAELRERLRAKDALVVYYIGPKTAFALVADRNQSRIVRLPITRSELESAISDTAQLLGERVMIRRDRVSPELKDKLEALYGKLIAPLDIPAGAQRLIIVPDKALEQVPWPALSEPVSGVTDWVWSELGYASLKPLLLQYQINVLPSSMLLEPAAIGSHAIDRAVFVASGVGKAKTETLDGLTQEDLKEIGGELPALDGTVKEVENAQNALGLMPAQTTKWLFSREDGTMERPVSDIVASFANHPLIHLAAHGFFNATNPMASFLLLATQPRPMVLRAADLLTVNLQSAELVMLSACSSGEVRISTGQEIFGFWRALFASGAKRVILTRWPVDDQTTLDYVSDFYKRLGAGEEIDTAQQDALRSLVSKHAHPFYWAGYILSSRI